MARTEDQDTGNPDSLITKTLLNDTEETNGGLVSSESESSSVKTNCPHINKSTNSKNVKKIHSGGFSSLKCSICSKEEAPQNEPVAEKDLQLCLMCGSCNCATHVPQHFDSPHSDPHNLILKLSNWSVWCYKCKVEIPIESSGKLKEEIKALRQHNNKIPKIQIKPNNHKTVQEIDISAPGMESSAHCSRNVDFSSSYTVNNTSSVPAPTTFMPQVRGLTNLGNTCFFNSVLQCLAQTPYLLEILLEIKEPGQEVCIDVDENNQLIAKLDEWGSVTRALANTLTEITRPNGGVFSPSHLLDALRSRCRYFIGYNQHDAHELLRQLLDSVKMEDIRRYQVQILQYFGLSKKTNPEEVDENKRNLAKQLNQKLTEIINIRPDPVFRGTLVSTVQCMKCFHTSEVVESFLDLSLSVSFDRPQPPVVTRRKNSGFIDSSNDPKVKSKHQKKKEKKAARRANKSAKIKKRWKDDDVDIVEISVAATEAKDINESGYSSGKPSSPVQNNGNTISNENSRNEILAEALNEINSPTSVGNNSTNDEENETAKSIPKFESIAVTNIFDADNVNSESSSDVIFTNAKQTKLNALVDEISNASPVLCPIVNHVKNDLTEPEASCSSSSSSEMRFRLVNSTPPQTVAKSDSSSAGSVNDDDEDDDDDQADAEDDGGSAEEDASNDYIMETPETSVTLQPLDEYDESSILSCLSQFTACEILTGNNKVCCESCTGRQHKIMAENSEGGSNTKKKPVYQAATKQLLIHYPPPVLILHLKRFQAMCFSFRKVTKFITYPLILDIAPFCSNKCQKLLIPSQNKILYSLYGIVEHMGSLHGGHYVAYVKVRKLVEKNSYRRLFLPKSYHSSIDEAINIDDMEQKLNEFKNSKDVWYCISDSFVKSVSEEEILNKQAYLLFYERIL